MTARHEEVLRMFKKPSIVSGSLAAKYKNELRVLLAHGLLRYTGEREPHVDPGTSWPIAQTTPAGLTALEDGSKMRSYYAGRDPIPEIEAEYLKADGNLCPYCSSKRVKRDGPVEIDSDGGSQEVACLDCDAGWYAFYKLTGFGTKEG